MVMTILIKACLFLRTSDKIAAIKSIRVVNSVSPLEIFEAIPVMSFSFTYHMNIFPIMNEMVNTKQVRKVSIISVNICLITYLFVSIFGYVQFGNQIQGNILNNYPDEDVFISLARIALSLIMCFSYPVLGYSARDIFDQCFFKTRSPPYSRILTESAVFVVLSLVLAIAVPGIQIIFGIVGASFGNMIVYILPAIFYLMVENSNYLFERKATFSTILLIKFAFSTKHTFIAIILVIVGVCFAVISLVSIAVDLS